MNARRFTSIVLALLCVVTGGSLLASASALAAEAPEAPAPVVMGAVTGSAATFHGELNPGKTGGPGIYEVDTYEFLYRQSATECEGGSTAPESPGISLGGGQEVLPPVEVSGLRPNSEYTVCLLARNEAGETALGQPVTFKTELVAPVLGEAWVSDVASNSATFNAQINPEGSETTYRFEYGASETYGSSIPLAVAGVGSGAGVVTVQAHVQGLQPGTTYHFRVVASSAGGTEQGSNHEFTMQAAGGKFSLLDGRQWELVTPQNKHGAQIIPWEEEGGIIQAAANGDGIAYLTDGPITAEPAGDRSPELSSVLSRRSAGGGWTTQDIATPHNEARGVAVGDFGGEYQLFSADLSLAVVEPRGLNPLSPEATERTAYLRDDETGAYVPLVTAANTAPGTKFGGPPNNLYPEVEFVSGSPDLRHLVLASPVPLTENSAHPGGLYEWAAGKLQRVNVLPGPGETPAPVGSLGGATTRNAISVDGSLIVWSNYLRDMIKHETIALGGIFEDASSDTSKIFLNKEGNLVECEVETAGELACPLKDLTTPENVGESTALQIVVGVSEDGSYVYFAARGALADGATPGGENLYVYHEGTTAFIATLSEEDMGEGLPLPHLTMRVSPNGQFVAFMSDRSLTGYDNRDAVSGEPDAEVYLYDAVSKYLVCASCNPTGARPRGIFDPGGFPGLLIDQPRTLGGRWLAASVPGWTKVNLLEKARYQPSYLSDSGRVFFDSPDALVPQDINGLEDVYEYEPEGDGSCRDAAGCVGLVSSGSSGEESAFLGASESGDDVFFMTAGQLVETDKDHAYDIYDAHVCGAEGVPCPNVVAAAPACTTADSCRAAPSPQPAVFGAPASATFSGSGNLAPPLSKAVVKAGKSKAKGKRKRKKGKAHARNGRLVRSERSEKRSPSLVRPGAKRKGA